MIQAGSNTSRSDIQELRPWCHKLAVNEMKAYVILGVKNKIIFQFVSLSGNVPCFYIGGIRFESNPRKVSLLMILWLKFHYFLNHFR